MSSVQSLVISGKVVRRFVRTAVEDYPQANNVVTQNSAKLKELQGVFDREAQKYPRPGSSLARAASRRRMSQRSKKATGSSRMCRNDRRCISDRVHLTRACDNWLGERLEKGGAGARLPTRSGTWIYWAGRWFRALTNGKKGVRPSLVRFLLRGNEPSYGRTPFTTRRRGLPDRPGNQARPHLRG